MNSQSPAMWQCGAMLSIPEARQWILGTFIFMKCINNDNNQGAVPSIRYASDKCELFIFYAAAVVAELFKLNMDGHQEPDRPTDT